MPRTRNESLWIVGAAVVALLMAVVGYFLLIGPQRTRTAAVKNDVSTASFQATTLQSRITSLTAQSRQISAYRTALTRAREALPAADDRTATPQLLRTLATTAAASSTTITSLTVGDPAPVTPTAPTAPTTGSSAGSSGTSASASETPAANPAATAAPALSSIALGATVTGSMTNLTRFLATLQARQPRALLVTAVTVTGSASGPGASMNLTMSAFTRAAQ